MNHLFIELFEGLVVDTVEGSFECFGYIVVVEHVSLGLDLLDGFKVDDILMANLLENA